MDKFKSVSKALAALIVVYALYSVYTTSSLKITSAEESRKKRDFLKKTALLEIKISDFGDSELKF